MLLTSDLQTRHEEKYYFTCLVFKKKITLIAVVRFFYIYIYNEKKIICSISNILRLRKFNNITS